MDKSQLYDIYNSLTAINTFNDYLLQKFDDPSFRDKFYKLLKKEAAHIYQTVASLADSKPIKQLCRVEDLLLEITDLFKTYVLKPDTDIYFEFKGSPQAVVGNSDKIKQAFLNILLDMNNSNDFSNNTMIIHVPNNGIIGIAIAKKKSSQ